MPFLFALFFFCAGSFAFGDYAWITPYQKLQLRTGLDVFTTADNYSNTGTLDPVRFGSQNASLSDWVFWAEPEYGIAKDWTLGLKVGFLSGSLSNLTGQSLASGSGLTDLRTSLKWEVSNSPLLTLETFLKFPLGNSRVVTTDALVVGEGNFDLGVKAHLGLKTGPFFLSASPGFIARTGGYASAVTLDLAAQAFLQRVYFKVFGTSQFALSAEALSPSTINGQTLSGSGGSYARLAASPVLIAAGGSLGFLFNKDWRMEAGLTRSIWGLRAPSYLSFTVNVLGVFDFNEPDLKPKLRSVPFENMPQDF
jgi:hypothetical protein